MEIDLSSFARCSSEETGTYRKSLPSLEVGRRSPDELGARDSRTETEGGRTSVCEFGESSLPSSIVKPVALRASTSDCVRFVLTFTGYLQGILG
jgi:hypothetical protein